MEQRELPVTASTEKGPIDPEVSRLTESEAVVRQAAFRSIRQGRASDAAELAEATGLGVEAVEDAVRSLVRKGQAVVDGGPPVPPYEIPSLFEPFRRLSTTERLAGSTATSISRGAGLGLSIVRSIAHAHGGDVHASPREHGGLTVQVRLPAAVEKPVPNSAALK